MSYIDTFDHELVGFFAGLAVYHPLETVQESSPWEFATSPSSLVLGGGEGEHPALLLTRPAEATMHFVQYVLATEHKVSDKLSTKSLDVIYSAPSSSTCLIYAGWSLRDFAAFYDRCTSSSFVHPYSPVEAGWSLEDWIVSSLGEFVYFSMPELAASLLDTLPDVRETVRTPVLFNVLILPPGFRTLAGRSRDNTGNVMPGNYRWTAGKHATAKGS